MPRISVFIPVYRESRILPKTLRKLTAKNSKKEIFIIADEPTQPFLQRIRKFRKKVKLVVNEKRKGKARALNEAVKFSSGEILLFLDSDVEIKGKDFLEKIVKEMKDSDILDIRKEVVKDSLLSRLTYYEYAGFNIGSWLLSKFLKKCPSINGSAFAIRREVFESLKGFRRVIAEDLDLAMRAFLKGYKFKYSRKASVKNYVHSSWRKWFIQRRRWSIGSALWFKRWWKVLTKESLKHPQLFIPSLFFLFPSLLVILISSFIPNFFIYKTFSLLLVLLSIKFNLFIPVLGLTLLTLNFLKGLIASLLTFFAFSALFFTLSRKLSFSFKLHEFFLYYFFYSLLWLLINLASLISVFLFKKSIRVPRWKV